MYQATINMTLLERVYSGRPAVEALGEEVERLGVKRVFLVCSNTLRHKTDEVSKLQRLLGARLIGIFDSVRPHVPREDVVAAAKMAHALAPDLLVSLGGGSVTV
jgi:maleylacetate reductase